VEHGRVFMKEILAQLLSSGKHPLYIFAAPFPRQEERQSVML